MTSADPTPLFAALDIQPTYSAWSMGWHARGSRARQGNAGASVSVLTLGVCRGIEMVISVPGDVARTSHCPPAASAFARIDARPM